MLGGVQGVQARRVGHWEDEGGKLKGVRSPGPRSPSRGRGALGGYKWLGTGEEAGDRDMAMKSLYSTLF